MALPAGVTPTPADLGRWIEYGFSAVLVDVPMSYGGRFPAAGVATAGGTGAGTDTGLDQTAALVRAMTDRGFHVVLRVVPVAGGATPPAPALIAGLGRLAGRFRGTGGLVGFEISAQAAARAPGAAGEVIRNDPFHLLWREQPAPFDGSAEVAVNDPAGYLVGWSDGAVGTVRRLAAAADAFGIGWFYGRSGGTAAQVSTPPADIVRPYPVAVAGVPEAFGYQADGGFTLTYRSTPVAGGHFPPGTATAVSLPAWSYPTGYRAAVTGARVVSAPGSGLLCLVADAGGDRVEVHVTPARVGAAPTAPPLAGAGACPAVAGTTAGTTPGRSPSPTRAAAPASADRYSGPLLWALPLAGAAGMAALLGPVVWRVRRRS
jgi:hypothetical protein